MNNSKKIAGLIPELLIDPGIFETGFLSDIPGFGDPDIPGFRDPGIDTPTARLNNRTTI